MIFGKSFFGLASFISDLSFGRSSILNAMSSCSIFLMYLSWISRSDFFVLDCLTIQPVRARSKSGLERFSFLKFLILPRTLSSAFCFTEQELKMIRSASCSVAVFVKPSLSRYDSILSVSE